VSHLVTYVMPIRSAALVDEELFEYLQGLISMTAVAEVIVVDGSDAPVFADFESRRLSVYITCAWIQTFNRWRMAKWPVS
jgi:hypothetical protein